MTARQYPSGAAKRKLKQVRLQNEAKGRRTLEEFGWCEPKQPEQRDHVDESDQYEDVDSDTPPFSLGPLKPLGGAATEYTCS